MWRSLLLPKKGTQPLAPSAHQLWLREFFPLSLHFFHVSLFCHTRMKPALQTSRFPWLSAAEDTPACLRSAPSYTGHVAEQMLEADRPKAGSQTAQNLDENLHLVVVWVLVEALLTTSPGRAARSPRVLVP